LKRIKIEKRRDIAAFVLLHPTFPSDSPLVSLDFPHIPLEVGRWPLGYEKRRSNCPCNSRFTTYVYVVLIH